MATRSKYICEGCKNTFDSTCGDLMRSKEFRCSSCDTVKYVPHSEVDKYNFICEKCGGKTDVFESPMCPVCKSRNTKATELIMMVG